MNVMIDTEIWSMSVKKPVKTKFDSAEAYKKAVLNHEKAKTLVKRAFFSDTIYMSLHQISEIFHVLAYRGTKLPLDYAKTFVKELIEADEVIKIDITWEDLLESIRLSSATGIHIWDFLCFIPLKKHIQVVYTADKHFTHSVFKAFGVKIINPFDSWLPL